MTRWEHQSFSILHNELGASANKLGAEGWQLVQISTSHRDENGKVAYVVWFKRERETLSGGDIPA